ncbi:MAG: nucleoside deaminase [Bacteriovoracia bacterium]
MTKAFDQAKLALKKNEVPVGAVVVRGQEILSRAYNLKETKNDPLAHAEILAVKKATRKIQDWRLNECTLYVTLEPCVMCAAVLQQARIGRIVFGAFDKKGGALSLGFHLHDDSRLNHRYKMEYLESFECSKILTDFFHGKRGKKG